MKEIAIYTVWKVFKYEVFSGPYFHVFRLNTEIYEESRSVSYLLYFLE